MRKQDILGELLSKIKREQVEEARESARASLGRPHWQRLRALAEDLPEAEELGEITGDLSSAAIRVGKPDDLLPEQRERLRGYIRELIPWRKGPIELFGEYIDSEWRSDLKWERILPYLDPLEGKCVADFGCNNGYYLFRAAHYRPRFAIGFDPYYLYYLQFSLLKRYLHAEPIAMELLGVEHAPLFPQCFDIVFLMGILYHQRSPLDVLGMVKEALKPGGQIIVENIAIPGDEPIVLSPPGRYGKMRNVFFLPTSSALVGWMERSGFGDVRVIAMTPLSTDEQRKTPLAPFESLEDFLDPDDRSRTVEGHPAPWRIAVSGRA